MLQATTPTSPAGVSHFLKTESCLDGVDNGNGIACIPALLVIVYLYCLRWLL